MLLQGFCQLKIKITQFPGGFRLVSFFPVEFFKNHCTFSFSNAKSFRRKKSGDHQFDFLVIAGR